MPAPTANPVDIDATRQYVTDPERVVQIGDQTFTQGDVQIQLTHDGRTASFRVDIWNLSQSSFHGIERGDPAEIRLGWRNGPTDRVVQGVVTGTATGGSHGDYKYRIRGRSDGASAAREQITASWQNATTTTIVRDIADRLGLSVGTVAPPPNAASGDEIAAPRIDGYWQLRGTKRVRAGLDRLVRLAGRETGHQWTWYIDNGALSFHPKRKLPRDETRLTTADSILQLQPEQGMTGETNETMPFRMRAYATPNVRKGTTLVIAHTAGGKARRQGGHVPERAKPGGPGTGASPSEAVRRYRVVRYQFSSGTNVGDHNCTALLVPASARYKVGDGA